MLIKAKHSMYKKLKEHTVLIDKLGELGKEYKNLSFFSFNRKKEIKEEIRSLKKELTKLLNA